MTGTRGEPVAVDGIASARRIPQTWSLWWTPLELSRRWAGYARETALEAIAETSRMGDRLAAIEDPANRLVPVVIEHLQHRQEAAPGRLRRWLTKGGSVDTLA